MYCFTSQSTVKLNKDHLPVDLIVDTDDQSKWLAVAEAIAANVQNVFTICSTNCQTTVLPDDS